MQRVHPNTAESLCDIEQAISTEFIPALFDTDISSDTRELISMPARFGGMGIENPLTQFDAYETSKSINNKLSEQIINQDSTWEHDVGRKKVTAMYIKLEEEGNKSKKANILERATADLKTTMFYCSEKGSSQWLTTTPRSNDGLSLNRQEFRDAIRLRYALPLAHLPSTCVCGNAFTTSHALTCSTGGFISRRHNELRDLLARIMSDVCYDVQTEPMLIPVTKEEMSQSGNMNDASRLDISARGFWRHGQRAFFDIRVFNPLAPTNANRPPKATYKAHEQEKLRAYQTRVINIEHSSFTPVVFSALGGTSELTKKCLSQLGSLIAEKKKSPQSETMNWLRTRISFAQIRSTMTCIRGTRIKIKPQYELNTSNFMYF